MGFYQHYLMTKLNTIYNIIHHLCALLLIPCTNKQNIISRIAPESRLQMRNNEIYFFLNLFSNCWIRANANWNGNFNIKYIIIFIIILSYFVCLRSTSRMFPTHKSTFNKNFHNLKNQKQKTKSEFN